MNKRDLPAILVVEDEPAFMKLYQEVLKDDFQVIPAIDGQDALDVLEKRIPDLMLLDLEIPKVSGLGVLQKVRKQESLKSVPVIVFSHMSDPELEIVAKGLGAVAFVRKDMIDIQDLAAECKKYL